MSKLIISTTVRNALPNQNSGNIYIFDLLKKRITSKTPIIESPYRNLDPNPRGGIRGSKGIVVNKNEIFISNGVSIFRFDYLWNLLAVISHPSCASIHGICLGKEDSIWVTSTQNDLLFNFDKNGILLRHINIRKVFGEKNNFGIPKNLLSNHLIINPKIDFRDPSTHNTVDYDGTHINSVYQNELGDLFISLGFIASKKYIFLIKIKNYLDKVGLWKNIITINNFLWEVITGEENYIERLIIQPAKGMANIIRISNTGGISSLQKFSNCINPGHSLIYFNEESIYYLHTSLGKIINLHLESGKIMSEIKVTDRFLRGGRKINKNQLALGMGNKLAIYDVNEEEISQEFFISINESEAIFEIEVFPDRFQNPPPSFNPIIKENNLF